MSGFFDRDARAAALFRAGFGAALCGAAASAGAWLALPALVAFAVGYRTRTTGVAAFAIAYALHAQSIGSFEAGLAFWALFADLGARWSLDRLLGLRPGRARVPGLPIALLQLQWALGVVAAARGLAPFSPSLWAGALLLLPGRAIDAALALAARAVPEIDLLYDGHCGFCRRSVRVVRALDVFDRVRPLDAHDPAVRARHPSVDAARTERELVTVAGARVLGGFDAFRSLAWRLPILWIAVPLGYLPPVPQIGRAVYRWIAARRARAACPIGLAAPIADEPARRGPLVTVLAALLVAQMALVLAGAGARLLDRAPPPLVARELAALGFERPPWLRAPSP